MADDTLAFSARKLIAVADCQLSLRLTDRRHRKLRSRKETLQITEWGRLFCFGDTEANKKRGRPYSRRARSQKPLAVQSNELLGVRATGERNRSTTWPPSARNKRIFCSNSTRMMSIKEISDAVSLRAMKRGQVIIHCSN